MARHLVNLMLDNGTKDVEAVGDAVTNAIVTLEYDHHEVHEGDSYVVSGTATLDSGGVLNVLIVTPNTTKWAHLLPIVVVNGGAATIAIYEDATVSAVGSAAEEINRNRNSANTAGVVVTTGPTVTGTGTQIFTFTIGDGQQTGGEVRGTYEWVLKQNTIYLLRITSLANGNVVNYLLDWYEHTSKG